MITFRSFGKIIVMLITCFMVYFISTLQQIPFTSLETPRSIVQLDDSHLVNSQVPNLLTIAIYPNAGIIPGIVANGGLVTNSESIYQKEEKINIRFVIEEDPFTCYTSLQRGEVDLIWSKFAFFVSLYEKFYFINPVAIMVYGFSNGSVQIRSKNTLLFDKEIKNIKIACVPQGDSHSFLLYLLKGNGIQKNSIKWYYTQSDCDAVALLQKGTIDVIGISRATADGAGHIAISSYFCPVLFPEIFVTREDILLRKKEIFIKFLSGWLKGIDEIHKNRGKALAEFARALGILQQNAEKIASSFLIAGLKENLEFFGVIRSKNITFDTHVEITKSLFDISSTTVLPAMMRNNEILLSFANQKKGAPLIEFSFTDNTKATIEKVIRDVRIPFTDNEYILHIDAVKKLEKFVQNALLFTRAKVHLSGVTATSQKAEYNYTWGMRFYTVKKFLTDCGIAEGNVVIKSITCDSTLAEKNSDGICCSLVLEK
ncbi:MAG: hypothetical protein N2316_03850 [Spirochaetes bacterium]|nr:hypothetical protein [Spirochaetota bacterium]